MSANAVSKEELRGILEEMMADVAQKADERTKAQEAQITELKEELSQQ